MGLLGGSDSARHAHVPVAYSALDESPEGSLGKVSDGVDSYAHLFDIFDESSGGLLGGSDSARHAHVPVAYSALDESPGGLLGKVSDGADSHAHLFYMFDENSGGLLGES